MAENNDTTTPSIAPYLSSYLDYLVFQTFITQLRSSDSHLIPFQRRFFRETGCNVMPIEYVKCIMQNACKIRADFFSVSGDSEIQVCKLSLPMAIYFAQRPSLLISTFLDNGLGMLLMCTKTTPHRCPSPDTFLNSFSPGLRRMIWTFCAVVFHALRRTGVTRSKFNSNRGAALSHIVKWLGTSVCGWSHNVPAIIFLNEIIELYFNHAQ